MDEVGLMLVCDAARVFRDASEIRAREEQSQHDAAWADAHAALARAQTEART